jgi:hypothetical protein
LIYGSSLSRRIGLTNSVAIISEIVSTESESEKKIRESPLDTRQISEPANQIPAGAFGGKRWDNSPLI